MRVSEKRLELKNGQHVTLRSPEVEDTEPTLLFLRQLFRESSDNMNGPPDRFDKTSHEEEAKFLQEFISAEKNFCVSAFSDRQIVGNLSFTAMTVPVSLHCGQLGLGVLKSHQGLGIGTMLMEHCLETARQLGIWNIRFTVRTHNSAAIHLYEKLGFERIGLLRKVARIRDEYVDEYLYQGVFDE